MYLGRPSLDFSGSLGDHGKDGIDCPLRPRSQPVPVLKEEAAHPKTFAELLFAATDEKKAGKELQAGRSSRACRGSFSGRAKYGMQAFSFREFLLMRERALPPFAVPVPRINPLPTTQARLKRMATKPVKAPDPFAATIQPVAEVVPVKLVKKVGPVQVGSVNRSKQRTNYCSPSARGGNRCQNSSRSHQCTFLKAGSSAGMVCCLPRRVRTASVLSG